MFITISIQITLSVENYQTDVIFAGIVVIALADGTKALHFMAGCRYLLCLHKEQHNSASHLPRSACCTWSHKTLVNIPTSIKVRGYGTRDLPSFYSPWHWFENIALLMDGKPFWFGWSFICYRYSVKKMEKYLQIGRTRYFWSWRHFHLFTGLYKKNRSL